MKTIGFKIVIFLLLSGNLFAQIGRENEQTQSTISVHGISIVSAQPDTVQMTISLNKTEKTTQLAQQEVSRLVRRALLILKENNIDDKNMALPRLWWKMAKNDKIGGWKTQIRPINCIGI